MLSPSIGMYVSQRMIDVGGAFNHVSFALEETSSMRLRATECHKRALFSVITRPIVDCELSGGLPAATAGKSTAIAPQRPVVRCQPKPSVDLNHPRGQPGRKNFSELREPFPAQVRSSADLRPEHHRQGTLRWNQVEIGINIDVLLNNFYLFIDDDSLFRLKLPCIGRARIWRPVPSSR